MIRAVGLGKQFKIYPNPWGRLTEWLTLGRLVRHGDFQALRDVTFSVGRGESLGVIGVNGSGKSTLLKILSGALYPTEGTFQIEGRVLSLLELGTGLNPELTGRANVLNSSRLLAFPPGYAGAKMAEIEAFADLAEGFFDRPVKLYSSGMLVRLVFSMFACFDPDVFIVDEALSVGDVFFQQKCARRLQQMRAGGVTMLFVSHDLAAVEALCDRVMVLHAGTVRHDGDSKAGIALYYALGGRAAGGGEEGLAAGHERPLPDGSPAIAAGGGVRSEPERSPETMPTFSPLRAGDAEALPWQPPDARDAIGDGRVEITGICYRRADGGDEPVVGRGGWLQVMLRAEARSAARSANFGLAIHDRHDRLLFARGWVNAGMSPVDLAAGDHVVARFALKLDLEPGEYIISLAATETLRDPGRPGGWDQDVGGQRYRELPYAGRISVVPVARGDRSSFGPANLRSRLDAILMTR